MPQLRLQQLGPSPSGADISGALSRSVLQRKSDLESDIMEKELGSYDKDLKLQRDKETKKETRLDEKHAWEKRKANADFVHDVADDFGEAVKNSEQESYKDIYDYYHAALKDMAPDLAKAIPTPEAVSDMTEKEYRDHGFTVHKAAQSVKRQIKGLEGLVEAFKDDTGEYPTQEEYMGLAKKWEDIESPKPAKIERAVKREDSEGNKYTVDLKDGVEIPGTRIGAETEDERIERIKKETIARKEAGGENYDKNIMVAAQAIELDPKKVRDGKLSQKEAESLANKYSEMFGTLNLLEMLMGAQPMGSDSEPLKYDSKGNRIEGGS